MRASGASCGSWRDTGPAKNNPGRGAIAIRRLAPRPRGSPELTPPAGCVRHEHDQPRFVPSSGEAVVSSPDRGGRGSEVQRLEAGDLLEETALSRTRIHARSGGGSDELLRRIKLFLGL